MSDYINMTIERGSRSRDLAIAAMITGDYDAAALAIKQGREIVKIANIANQRGSREGVISRGLAGKNARAIAVIAADLARIAGSPLSYYQRAILADPGGDRDHNGQT